MVDWFDRRTMFADQSLVVQSVCLLCLVTLPGLILVLSVACRLFMVSVDVFCSRLTRCWTPPALRSLGCDQFVA